MDINALNVPTASSTKNSNTQQNESRADENQAPALPFQAMLDNQQPIEKQHVANQPVNEEALNKDIVDNKLAIASKETVEQTQVGQKNAENTIEQLNFSRSLRADSVQTALNTELLTGKDANEQAWLNNLKQSLTGQVQTVANTAIKTESHPVLGAFTQKMQHLTDNTNGIINDDDGKHLEGSQLQLAGEEDSPELWVFIKNEKEERRDQSHFPLDNQREIRGKNLTADFMPLNKKVSDKEPILNLQNVSSDALNQTAKGAFTLQTETGAFTTASSQHTTTMPVSMMPTATTTQAAAMNAPTATPTMHLASQLGSEAWQQQLSQHMLFFSRQGVSQAQIRLHPEELGSLNVHLRIEDNQAVMHFVSPHSHVRAVMESMMPVLRSALQESGIHLAQGSVGQDNLNHQSDNPQQGTHQPDGQIQATHPSMGAVGISEANATVSPITTALRQGGINTFA
ncbi:flagellar hook-length control protein FliK [Providencia rettgeri]|uniref:flagellar hook-length control protein FliK n=1 Tax=Providencia TaxID=586 RepID=UPI001BD43876|nr:flagellar hook-length control protein FliK [Providencia rettgeri]ELR5070864.1 flagellar hook-length control protein FliK [Providencia rettgeri]ELR5223584.1 flagellar hook-length control protein FliK [Providencia rettgeri]MDX7320407.1 flagellar hook-length control protein FliK [Providencia rettgeri]